jgi:hypothetical protein
MKGPASPPVQFGAPFPESRLPHHIGGPAVRTRLPGSASVLRMVGQATASTQHIPPQLARRHQGSAPMRGGQSARKRPANALFGATHSVTLAGAANRRSSASNLAAGTATSAVA